MKINKYILIIAAAAAMASCGNDWLDLEPSTRVESATSINLVSEAKYALNSVYNTMQDAYAYSGRLVYYGDVTGDDMIAVSSTKRTGNYYRFGFSRDNAPSTHWSYLYNMIANCNVVLNKIDNLPAQNDDEKELGQQVKGEALVLRAMALFDLCRFYGYPYMKDGGKSLGASIVTEPGSIDSKPARSTVAECYTQIISDLTAGVSLIGEDFQKGHINKWGALTLLSRVYLYKGDNANALKTAQEAIAGAEKNKYALWTTDEYPTAWANDASATKPGEVLFEIVNLTTDSPGKESLGYLHSGSGYKDLCVTGSFYKLLSSDSKDVRLKLVKIASKIGYCNKYQPQEGEAITDANIPLIRLSEAYLNAAEAAQKLGDNANAVKYLDPIVKRANPSMTVEGETITLDRVLTERRKELFGEGHRMFDLMRNGLKVERKNVSVSAISKTPNHFSQYLEFDWNFHMIILPIPKYEMDTNPQMVQNPEY
ncbi:MAG: RagB/SusD family nutrient uptake outer membrane protein [Prevotella sp.]|nr:RagB/SusD family nutrient uptake outer membrane protein [Prevotella sp.]